MQIENRTPVKQARGLQTNENNIVYAVASSDKKSGIGGSVTFVRRSSASRRRAIMAWRRNPRSHGIFVVLALASVFTDFIQRFSVILIYSNRWFVAYIGAYKNEIACTCGQEFDR